MAGANAQQQQQEQQPRGGRGKKGRRTKRHTMQLHKEEKNGKKKTMRPIPAHRGRESNQNKLACTGSCRDKKKGEAWWKSRRGVDENTFTYIYATAHVLARASWARPSVFM